MLTYTIIPERFSSKKSRSGKLRFRIRVFDSETNKTYSRKCVGLLAVEYLNDLLNRVKLHCDKIEKLKEELTVLENTRVK